MSTVQAILRKKSNKSGLFPIAIRVTKNRKSIYLYTGQYIEEKLWDNKNHRVRKSHPNSARINNLILKKLSEANDNLLETEVSDRFQSVKAVKKKMSQKGNVDFFVVAEMHLKNLNDRKQFNQSKAERGRLELFKKYINKSELLFIDLDVSLLKKFQTYLLYGKKLAPRSVVNYMIVFRTIYNLAIAEEITDRKNYPFGKGMIQIKFPETVKIGLNRDEIQILEKAKNLTGAQQHALNVWLLSFYFAGIRVGDTLELRWSDFKDGRLYYRMNKNEKLVSLKVPGKAHVILDIYSKGKGSKNNLIFPELKNVDFRNEQDVMTRIKTSTRKFNRHLKKIAIALNIEKNISMHIARHSFGNISGDRIPIQMLQKLYRHSSVTTTINYQANFIHKETDDALDKVINF
ncbi:MAG: site-specific integrase [Flavobacteriaceae bacterium]|nr:site-specific integrase [Flavobacteriaceae bacterium]